MTVVAITSVIVSILALVLSIVLLFRTASTRSVARSQERALRNAQRTEAEARALLTNLKSLNAEHPRTLFVPIMGLDWTRDAEVLRVLASLDSTQLARIDAHASADLALIASKGMPRLQWAPDFAELAGVALKVNWAKTQRTPAKEAPYWDASATGALPAAV